MPAREATANEGHQRGQLLRATDRFFNGNACGLVHR
jgi:hypothetical protein